MKLWKVWGAGLTPVIIQADSMDDAIEKTRTHYGIGYNSCVLYFKCNI